MCMGIGTSIGTQNNVGGRLSREREWVAMVEEEVWRRVTMEKELKKKPDGNLLMYKLPKMHKCTNIKGAVVL